MPSDLEHRFREFVDLHMRDGHVLSREAERDLIGDGIARFQLGGDHARAIVAAAAGEGGAARESELSRDMLAVMTAFGGKRGRIDKRSFEKGVVVLRALAGGNMPEAKARFWLKGLIADSDLTVKRRGLLRSRRWFNKIKAA